MAYSYPTEQMPCNGCGEYNMVGNVNQIPSKLCISYSGDIDKEGRKVITDLSVIASERLCNTCFRATTAKDVQRIQQYGVSVIRVDSSAFDTFCDKYADICAEFNIGPNNTDLDGEPYPYCDHSPEFIAGKCNEYDVAGFFVSPDIDNDEEKKGEDDEDDDITNSVPVPRFFTKPEIEALVEFINEHEYDKIYSLDKWLGKNKYLEYLRSKSLPVRKLAAYTRVYVSINLFLCRL